MRKTPGHIILLLLYLLCTADKCLSQLQIGGGTTWVSTSQTVVVLNDMGLKYNGTPATLLNNIFRFTGISGSYIGGGIQPYIYAISLAKTNPGKLLLARSANVKKRINFEAGLLDLNGNDIILDSNALLTNENELSRIIGSIGGSVEINVDLHTSSAANPGNLGAIITSTTNLGKVNLIRGHKPQQIKDSSVGIARYFDLAVKDNITFSASLRFTYFDQESKGFNKDSLVLWRNQDKVKWIEIGYTARDVSQNYVEKQGLDSLNRFTLYPATKSLATPPATSILLIGSGTTWVSTSETVVVVDDINLKYDGAPALLNNIFRFTGMTSSSISGSTQPYIYAIGLAKTNPGMLSLAQSAKVKKRINFEAGLFDLNGYDIILDSNALLTNEKELSRIIGPIGGTVGIKNVDLHAATTANPGNLGAIITSTTNLGKVEFIRGHKSQQIKDSSVSIARYYNLTAKNNLTFSGSLRFTYFDQESKGFNKDSLVLWRSPDAVKWTDIGFTTKDTNQKYVEKQGLDSLNLFTLYPLTKTSTSILPPLIPVPDINLLIGNWYNNAALLNWWVVSEYQTDHFSVERKYASEASFSAIATVPANAAGGIRSIFADYTFTDLTVKKGPDNISYRIHQVFTNGRQGYSNVITLKAKSSGTFIQKLFPTIAVGGRIYIEVGDMELQKMSFLILDTKGRIIQSGTLSYQSQWLPVNFLSSGLYHLVLLSNDQKFYSTFIK